MSIHNVSGESVMGASAGGPQCTLKEKISACPAEKVLTYGAASITVRVDNFPYWRRVLLKFDMGLRTLPANVTGVRMHPMNMLHQIDSISLFFDNVLVQLS